MDIIGSIERQIFPIGKSFTVLTLLSIAQKGLIFWTVTNAKRTY
jgi:hypothetical protein